MALGLLGTKDHEPLLFTTQGGSENPNYLIQREHIKGLSSNTETTKVPPQQLISTDEVSFRSSTLNQNQ